MKKNSIIHIYLYGMLKRELNGSKTLNITKIHPILKWTIRLPHKYRMQIIRELIECGFLRRVARDDYEILPIRCKAPSDSLGNPLW